MQDAPPSATSPSRHEVRSLASDSIFQDASSQHKGDIIVVPVSPGRKGLLRSPPKLSSSNAASLKRKARLAAARATAGTEKEQQRERHGREKP